MNVKVKIDRLSVYDNQILAILLVLAFVKPECFGQIAVLGKIYIRIQFVFAVFLLFLSVVDGKWTKSTVCIYLFFGVIFVTTLFGSGNVYEYCRSFFPILGMCLMFDLWSKHNVRVLFNAIGVLEIYIYINLLTIILFPEGLYESDLYTSNWFLGYKNPQIRTILPIVTVALIRSYWENGRINIRSYVLIICSMLTFILADSSTAIVGFGFFIILLVIFHGNKPRTPKMFTPLTVLLVVAVIFAGILFGGIQEMFSWLIEGVLGRSLTFTGRMTCWLNAVEYISERPVFGYGFLTSEDFTAMLGGQYYTHPHNLLLYLGMMGGLSLLIVFVIIIIFASGQLNKHREYIGSRIILFALSCFLIMGMAEALTSTVLFYPMLIMAINVSYLDKYHENILLKKRPVNKHVKLKLKMS